MAGRRSTLLRITGDPADAKRAIAEVRQDLRRLGREEVRARIQIESRGIEAQIEAVRARIERLSKQEASPKVSIQTAAAYRQLARLELTLARLGHKSVNIDVDVKRGALERTAAGLGSVERGIQGVVRGIANVFQGIPILGGLVESVLGGALSLAQSFGDVLAQGVTRGITALTGGLGALGSLAGPIGSVVGSIASLGGTLAGLAALAGGVVIALNAVLGAIVALGAALVALVASLAAAAAGFGALAIAFGAVLFPVVLVGIALFQRFSAVLKARQAHAQELAQATQRNAAAENAHQAALQRVKAAHLAVIQAEQQRKQAEQNLSAAIVAGHRAAAQAAIDERNAELALQDARLGLKGAKLNVLDAQKALKDLLAQAGVTRQGVDQLLKQFSDVHVDPSKLQGLLGAVQGAGGDKQKVDPLALAHAVLNLQQAQQGVRDAVNQTANAERALSDATRTRVDFARRGIRAYAPYRQALRAVNQAEDRVARAEGQLAVAHRKLATAQNGATTAQTKYQQALKGLSTGERSFLGSLDGAIKKLTDFAKLITGPIFAGLQRMFHSLGTLFSDSGIRSAFQAIGKAIGDFFASLGRELTSHDWRAAFAEFAAAGARMVGTGGRGFISLLRILREIARAALPELERILRDVSGWLGRIAAQPGAIHRAVKFLVDQFRVWAHFAGAVFRLVVALFKNAAPAGASLARSMTKIVDKWTQWINTHPGAVKQFFKDAVEKLKSIVSWIKDAVAWVGTHLPAAAKVAEKAFKTLGHIIDQIPIIGKNKLEHFAEDSVALLKKINSEAAKLKLHMSVEDRRSTRKELASDLRKLSKSSEGGLSGDFLALLKRLQALGFQSGGLVRGSGRGDHVPAMLEPGEFVLRRAVVSKLRTPILHMLNGGAVPALPAAGVGGDIHANFHVNAHPGQWIDENHVLAVAKMQLEALNRAVGTKS